MDFFSIFVALAVFWFIGFAHYKVAFRMGFPKSTAIIMAVVGYTGLMPIVWWWIKWPNEQKETSLVAEQ